MEVAEQVLRTTTRHCLPAGTEGVAAAAHIQTPEPPTRVGRVARGLRVALQCQRMQAEAEVLEAQGSMATQAAKEEQESRIMANSMAAAEAVVLH